MNKNRLEAFSDGVLAIIITIMVLELKAPIGSKLENLFHLKYVLTNYIISFIYVAIYWNNHHHLFQTIKTVNGNILWANIHLLFWLSLIPFVTAWSGNNEFATTPTAMYGVVLFMSAIAYYILVRCIIAQEGKTSFIANAMGKDYKGKLSVFSYAISIPLAFYNQWISVSIYALIAIVWFIPDSRIEKNIN